MIAQHLGVPAGCEAEPLRRLHRAVEGVDDEYEDRGVEEEVNEAGDGAQRSGPAFAHAAVVSAFCLHPSAFRLRTYQP